jgi:hypothetical protein
MSAPSPPDPTTQLAEQVAKASRELDRLHGLLADAIDSLIAHFESLSELSESQREIVRDALAQGLAAPNAALDARARENARDMAQHFNGALTALQFQDMSSQLISHIRERVGAIAELLGQPGTQIAPRAAAKPAAAAANEEKSWSAPAFGPVSSDKARGGSIELF